MVPNAIASGALISAFVEGKRLEPALELIKAMQREEATSKLVMCNSLLSAFEKGKHL